MEGLALTDIAICGMGGELIRDILSAAPFVKNASLRLILQPMSRAEVLRRYLADEGFVITEELRTRDGERLYTCMAASYTGKPYSLTLAEALLGKPERGDPLFRLFAEKHLAAAKKRKSGKEKGKENTDAEKAEIEALTALLEDI